MANSLAQYSNIELTKKATQTIARTVKMMFILLKRVYPVRSYRGVVLCRYRNVYEGGSDLGTLGLL
jgi:hypothetical protein